MIGETGIPFTDSGPIHILVTKDLLHEIIRVNADTFASCLLDYIEKEADNSEEITIYSD